jgi:hypothetical protein
MVPYFPKTPLSMWKAVDKVFSSRPLQPVIAETGEAVPALISEADWLKVQTAHEDLVTALHIPIGVEDKRCPACKKGYFDGTYTTEKSGGMSMHLTAHGFSPLDALMLSRVSLLKIV